MESSLEFLLLILKIVKALVSIPTTDYYVFDL